VTAPAPSALKVLRGTDKAQPSRVNRREPKGEPGGLVPPPWLSEKGRLVWDYLEPMFTSMRITLESDNPAFMLLAEALADYLVARNQIEEDGPYYTTETEQGSVMIRSHPAVADRNDAWRRARLALVDFGGTPSARTRVQTLLDEGDELDKWASGG
jgi:P27 family predicted phage terminase small subunit